jgi:hypothetical protein
LGGTITMNLQMSVAPDFPISDIKLPTQSTTDYTSVKIIIDAVSIQFDNGAVAGGIANVTLAAALP